MLNILKKIIPKSLFTFLQPAYHFLLAILGMIIYRFPAKHMTVIAVTGTKGKTSTTNFVHSVLSAGGFKVGLISTANIKIGSESFSNKYHMSMPGRFITQKYLSEMKRAGCTHVVVEATSEGIKQFRHLGLFIDVSVFTNLSPEHLQSHGGSYEKYRDTKARIFKKSIFNKLKCLLVNADDIQAENFLNADSGKCVQLGVPLFNKEGLGVIELEKIKYSIRDVSEIIESESGVDFTFENYKYHINILGKFNIYNALPAILLGKKYGLSESDISHGLLNLSNIPGRMERVEMGQDFKVIVDYAHERLSINTLLDTAQSLKKNEDSKVIIVLGGDGGGRDRTRLIDMGEAVGRKADAIVITNSDPYDDDQEMLANIIKENALLQNDFRKNTKGNLGDMADSPLLTGEKVRLGELKEGENIFVILDRAEGIKKAISLAKAGDIVLLATRGSLTTMQIAGKSIKSNDRGIVEQAFSEMGFKSQI